eukprot:TCONS_00002741-protein
MASTLLMSCICMLAINVLLIESRPPLKILSDFNTDPEHPITSPRQVDETSIGASDEFVKEATRDELEKLEPEMILIHKNAGVSDFYMTKFAKVKTTRLAKKVSRHWKGKYFLVIISAFISSKDPKRSLHHNDHSLHLEGRALDITIGTKADGKTVTIMDDRKAGRITRAEEVELLKILGTLARTGSKSFEFAQLFDNHVHISTMRREKLLRH